jgi:hypothetical protein
MGRPSRGPSRAVPSPAAAAAAPPGGRHNRGGNNSSEQQGGAAWAASGRAGSAGGVFYRGERATGSGSARKKMRDEAGRHSPQGGRGSGGTQGAAQTPLQLTARSRAAGQRSGRRPPGATASLEAPSARVLDSVPLGT